MEINNNNLIRKQISDICPSSVFPSMKLLVCWLCINACTWDIWLSLKQSYSFSLTIEVILLERISQPNLLPSYVVQNAHRLWIYLPHTFQCAVLSLDSFNFYLWEGRLKWIFFFQLIYGLMQYKALMKEHIFSVRKAGQRKGQKGKREAQLQCLMHELHL